MSALGHLQWDQPTGLLNLVRIFQLEQPIDDMPGRFFGTHLGRVDRDFGITRLLVRTVNTGEGLSHRAAQQHQVAY
jgi:hypothetical protein